MKFSSVRKLFSVSSILCVLCALCGLSLHAFALDRNAFTFVRYDLAATIDPEAQRIGVRGTIILRNDSSSPQKNLSLQISSSLDWVSIQFEQKPVEFLTHSYTSDIDHTGALSEAVVTLPREVQPGQAVNLSIGYDGTIQFDATRLTRIGVPPDAARQTDWDQISPAFTAVRGIGYVAWYPISTEAASLSDGDSVQRTVTRWKQRSAISKMTVAFESPANNKILCSGTPAAIALKKANGFVMSHLETEVPTFVIADYGKHADAAGTVFPLPGHEEAAASLNKQIVELQNALPSYLFGARLEVVDNRESRAAPFVSAQLLIMPFDSLPHDEVTLTLIYAMAQSKLRFRYAWVQEGLSHYAQAIYLEKERGRQAALDYMNAHEAELHGPPSKNVDSDSLLNGDDDLRFQARAARVWWMLHDMFGPGNDPGAVLFSDYKWPEDQSPSYVPKLLEAAAHRDLQWFFDDWVYHDRGLPDFRVLSVFPSKLASGGYLVTVTVENLGAAGAEVPITLHMAGGDKTLRLQVLGKSKNSIRFEVPAAPQQVTVNDGSVPESDMSNNTFTINK